MIIFIDESGDAGFRIHKGSSKTFTVVLIVFDEELEAEETALSIKKLKKTLQKKQHFEFKFSKCSKEYKKQFLETIKNSTFHIRALTIQKENIQSRVLRNSPDRFYKYAIKELIKSSDKRIRNAKIRIDGLGERLFKRSLLAFLRKDIQKSATPVIKNLKFRDSKKDVLIQLADMIAGSINRSFDRTKTDSNTYIKIVRNKIESHIII